MQGWTETLTDATAIVLCIGLSVVEDIQRNYSQVILWVLCLGFILWVRSSFLEGSFLVFYMKNSFRTPGGIVTVPDVVKGIIMVGINVVFVMTSFQTEGEKGT